MFAHFCHFVISRKKLFRKTIQNSKLENLSMLLDQSTGNRVDLH